MENLDNVDKEEEEEKDELIQKLIIDEEGKMKPSSKSVISNVSQELSIENIAEQLTNYDKSVKIILLGDSNVGKSSIVNCLQQDSNLQRKTISLECYNYSIKINKIILRMQIWDTVGQEKFDSITTNYYKTTDVAIFVYSINDENSFNNINFWDNELNNKGDINNKSNINETTNKSMIKVLVGNKSDLENERKVTYKQGEQLCNEKNFDFFMEINCKFYKSGMFNDKSEIEIKNDNQEKEKDKDSDRNSEEEKDEDCVKILFNEIGKIIYKQYIKELKNNDNSTIYNYEDSPSMLEDKEKKRKGEDNSCCC